MSWGFPVNDFVPGQVPRSDSEGVLILHHVNQGVEYSGQMGYLWYLLGYPFPIPRFTCRFNWEGQIVYEIEFRDLIRKGREIGVSQGEWDPCKYIEDVSLISADAPKDRWFGFIDELKKPETRSARARYYYVVGAIDTCWSRQNQKASSTERVTYQVYEHVITIPADVAGEGVGARGDNRVSE